MEVVSLSELAEILIAAHGGGEAVHKSFPADRKRIDIGDYYASYDLLKDTVGWSPRVPLRDGLKRTLEYYHDRLADYL